MAISLKEEQARLAQQQAVSDLAGEYVDEALASGIPFSEVLCDWALSLAEAVETGPIEAAQRAAEGDTGG